MLSRAVLAILPALYSNVREGNNNSHINIFSPKQ
jgi:hypothetical protein